MCEVYLRAREDKVLLKTQLNFAQVCEVLVRGLAIVGIVALVDEATGYQYERNKDELYKILEAYIAKELLPWTKRFPDEFYKEMFRLRGWSVNPISASKGPRYAGQLTNELVYERLPPGVLEQLKQVNPSDDNGQRRHRHHQFLTDKIGNPHLEKHVASVTVLMRVSRDWPAFDALFKRAFPVLGDQLPLVTPGQHEIETVDE